MRSFSRSKHSSEARTTAIALPALWAAYIGAHVIALALSKGPHGREAVIQTLGAAYLACLYAAVRITATARLLDSFGLWFGYSAAIAAALGLTGIAAAWMAFPTNLATVAATPVPYLGHAPRAQAFTAGPQMLASIILMAVPLFVDSRMGRGWRRRDVASWRSSPGAKFDVPV